MNDYPTKKHIEGWKHYQQILLIKMELFPQHKHYFEKRMETLERLIPK